MEKKITAKVFEVISKNKEMMDIFYNKNDLESQLIRLIAYIDSACFEASVDFASQDTGKGIYGLFKVREEIIKALECTAKSLEKSVRARQTMEEVKEEHIYQMAGHWLHRNDN